MVRTQSFTESLAIVASQIFGGKSSKDSEREVEEVGTAEDAIRAAQGML